MTAFAEGVDVSAAHRIFGHDERTLSDWLAKAGQHAQRLQERLLHDLQCGHLQLDELVTRVRSSVHRVWVWVAVDASTKLVAMVHIGRQKRDDALRFVHGLKGWLAPGCVPIIATDGLAAYFAPITAHFGRHVDQPGQPRLDWAHAYYNLVRPHEALRQTAGRGRHRPSTPAMAAGISSRPWQVRELLTYHLA